MFAGIFEIGYSFYTYGELVTAVRAGARYAALQPRGPATDPLVAKAVRNLVVYGDPAPDDRTKPLVPGLTTDRVELINSPDASTVSLHGFELDALFMKVKLDGRPTVTFPLLLERRSETARKVVFGAIAGGIRADPDRLHGTAARDGRASANCSSCGKRWPIARAWPPAGER